MLVGELRTQIRGKLIPRFQNREISWLSLTGVFSFREDAHRGLITFVVVEWLDGELSHPAICIYVIDLDVTREYSVLLQSSFDIKRNVRYSLL